MQSIRNTLAGEGFVEIEGPTLHAIAGGAAARPFVTHHNTLDMQLFLRIALELHLKRLLVGGMERVYELGRVYRNEGISPRHNPEFTMLEVYQAYGDYGSMMDLTEKLIVDAIDADRAAAERCRGAKDDRLHAAVRPQDVRRIVRTSTRASIRATQAAMRKLAEKIGFDTAGKHPDVIKSEVFEEKVEDQLAGPVFVLDYPASICPLTKRKAANPAVAERFELFIQGMEIANAYTELNDPDLQEQLFRTQLAGLAEEDSMAKMDDDFVRPCKHGMPPAGGLGVGIDRLVMLLTNSPSIRDVILFPLLRHVPVSRPPIRTTVEGHDGISSDPRAKDGAMYKLLLALRYLRTRWIALASIISVTLGVATMIVVNSVMAGFAKRCRRGSRAFWPMWSSRPTASTVFPTPTGTWTQIRRIAGDDIEGMTPRCTCRHAQLAGSRPMGHAASQPHRHRRADVRQRQRFRQVFAASGEPQAAQL